MPLKVTVATPVYEHYHGEMVASLIGALLRFPHDLHFTAPRGPYLDVNRELAIREALALKYDRIIFIDSDMVFKPDALTQLLSNNKDIVGGNYYEKKLPLVSTIRFDDGKGGYLGGKIDMPKVPFKCAAVATGFMAINLHRVKECLAPPYFAYGTLGTEFQGEDIGFCKRAKKAGLEIWCDPRIPLLHMGELPYGMIADFGKPVQNAIPETNEALQNAIGGPKLVP
jgi:hypothetical protein